MYVLRPGLGATGGQEMSAVGAGLMAAAAFTGPAAPFVAIAGLAVTFLGQMGVGSGCGQACVLSSQYANQAEALLRQNVAAYQALPVPRRQTDQTAALAIYDTIWNDLETQCSNPSLGDAGSTCISDRERGAQKWKSNGQQWDWFVGYRDPIANDPNVVADSAVSSTASALGSDVALPGGSSVPAWALLAAAVAAFFLVKG